ncbi:ParB N-terminal domain-containing protein [Xinfangfangia sp. D13-10-4-6]|uniref:ParB/RepB/Spo0J family partition protein n=1 Tax=Pseudogemmobacter hezensis TaxID=2737662 RepID=UPI001553465D|nr:ParB N-terminal domain-containing protein [Pseudogemmobacter hezensis]NPD16806.1 ParB N-terminal domain-containing protein [Pseudogemmobacter hezensis]
MKKRRTFDIDLPDADAEEIFPAGKDAGKEPSRRSPMAAAITETAEALRERRDIEAGIRAENDALAAEHVRMKGLGLIVDMVPLDQVETWKLVRDRVKGDDQELTELIASIRDLGLSNPIRVEQRDDGRYELVQGYRRLSAYRALLAETGDAEKWGRVPAGILPRGEDLEGLYRRMVDENMVRKDISFAEMAMLAISYAGDPGTKEVDPDRVVAELFRSAGYQKRSYIRQFIRLMSRLEKDLLYAHHIPRALGLKLAAQIEERPDLVTQIREQLAGWDTRSVTDELELLRRFAGGDEAAATAEPVSRSDARPAGKAKTTFQLATAQGAVKCTAGAGRLEIRMERDFSAEDRRKLEAGVLRLIESLG